MTKPLEQLAYEAFTKANGTPAIPWEQIADPSPRRGSPVALGAWKAVAAALAAEVRARVLTSERAAEQRFRASDPDRPVVCRCGARHLRGERHICNDDPELLKKLAGVA